MYRRALGAFAMALAALAPTPALAQGNVPLVDLGWLVVPVYLNDAAEPLRFVLDTGATGTSITAATAAQFARDEGQAIQVQGASGRAPARIVTVDALTVGGYRAPNRQVIALTEALLEAGGETFDGILGAEILSSFDVLIDVPNGLLQLLPRGD
jgi:predicted aspartyl protease